MWECGLKQVTAELFHCSFEVTPYVGVWIETKAELDIYEAETSLLMWECGLKLVNRARNPHTLCHSLCGSVD